MRKNLLYILLVIGVTLPLSQCSGGSNPTANVPEASPPTQTTAVPPSAGQGCRTVAECAQLAVQAAYAAQQAAEATDAKIKALAERLDKPGEVAAFAATSCPAPWQPYAPAVGRFVRGFDPKGSIDPDGKKRNMESLQDDSVGPHAHTMGINGMDTGANVDLDRFPNFGNHGTGGKKQTDTYNPDGETRPKNVALLYCILK